MYTYETKINEVDVAGHCDLSERKIIYTTPEILQDHATLELLNLPSWPS